MGGRKSSRVDEQAKEALLYFARHTTSDRTVNGILRSCQGRLDQLTRPMMYRINMEHRKQVKFAPEKGGIFALKAPKTKPKTILRRRFLIDTAHN